MEVSPPFFIQKFNMKNIITFITLSLTVFNCSENEKIYPVKGTIYEIHPDSMTIIIAHDTIPDLMYPMIMEFDLIDLSEIEGLLSGDSVHFEFVWGDRSTWARQFKVVGKGVIPVEDNNDYFDDEEYREKKIGEILDDVTLLKLDSSKVRLSDLSQKYKFISFIFTRCPMPTMCPAVVIKNEYLARAFKNNNEIEFIMISFDYKHDTPSILNEFYGPVIAEFENWQVWSSSGHIEDVYRIAKQSGCEFWGIDEGKIGHTLRSIFLAPNQELLGSWPGDNWKIGNVKNSIDLLMND